MCVCLWFHLTVLTFVVVLAEVCSLTVHTSPADGEGVSEPTWVEAW